MLKAEQSGLDMNLTSAIESLLAGLIVLPFCLALCCLGFFSNYIRATINMGEIDVSR